MFLSDIGMVAGDTSRTRAYLRALIRNNLLPSYVLLLEDNREKAVPGKALKDVSSSVSTKDMGSVDACWCECNFDPTEPLVSLLRNSGISYDIVQCRNINDDSVVGIIRERSENVFIFSGFGGALLRKNILSIGKKFLHVHGGYLPEYKGSTTNYYSLLSENRMGASSIFINEEIDCGPILVRYNFPAPPDRTSIDHIYDSAARAKVLVDTIKRYSEKGRWVFDQSGNDGGETYYIIHPVLKHIAMMSR